MRRAVATGSRLALGCVGLLISACNTPQPGPAVEAPEVHTQALAPEKASAPTAPVAPVAAAADKHASCGQAAEGCGCGAHAEGACGTEGHTQAAELAQTERPTDTDGADTTQLTRITDPSEVCMVRNHFMGRPQLSVAVQGGTYYGCCAGCANRLLADPGARVAIDPVTQKPVDKALAVLARTARGSVLYFENEQNLSAFRSSLH